VDASVESSKRFLLSTCLRSFGVCKCEFTLQTKGFLLNLALGW
jgi:hypothetical protein